VAEGLSAPTPVILDSDWTHGVFSLRVHTWRGKSYYLQRRASLSAPNWLLSPPIAGDNSDRVLSDRGASLQQGYYRVWQKP
jgi:hypothetical protein